MAQLFSPTRLLGNTRYQALLVPTHESGRAAALGEPLAEIKRTDPAWSYDPGSIDKIKLPVYAAWQFATAPTGTDFEHLVALLRPRELGPNVGVQVVDGSSPGPLAQASDVETFKVQGTLVSPRAIDEPLPNDDPLVASLNKISTTALTTAAFKEGCEGYKDPIYLPPVYGAAHAQGGCLDPRWLEQINTQPAKRLGVSIGTEIVRRLCEPLAAEAWRQLGELEAVNQERSNARTGIAAGTRILDRLASVSNVHEQLLRISPVIGSLLAENPGRLVLESGDQRIDLREAVENGTASPVLRKFIRPSSRIAKKLCKTPSNRESLLAPAVVSSLMKKPLPKLAPGSPVVDELLHRGKPTVVAELPEAVPPATTAEEPEHRVSLRSLLDPKKWIGKRTTQFHNFASDSGGTDSRVRIASDRIEAHPVFDTPLFEALCEVRPDWVLPDHASIPVNSVFGMARGEAALEILIGANHEMGRDLLFRGAPVPANATFFRRFWPYHDDRITDIKDMRDWHGDLNSGHSGDHVPDPLIVGVKGSLLLLHPSTVVYLLKKPVGNQVPEIYEPSFSGFLDPDTVFLGFDFSIAEIKNQLGRFEVVFSEQPFEPRFGLDDTPLLEGDVTLTRNDLCWQQFDSPPTHLSPTTNWKPKENVKFAADVKQYLTTARSDALATALFQQPVRVHVAAEHLL